jgi:purine catabolism regulator
VENSVEKLMKIGGLRECRVIAGYRGVHKKVNYVTIMEVPDIVRWLKGSELLLTSLYPIKDNLKAQKELIPQLHELGTAALAIKPNRFVDEIPLVILEEAEKLGFPIIEIPEHISYLDILAPVMNTIFNDKVVLQQDLEQASQLLNEISLNGEGIDRFIETLSFLTKNVITIESEFFYIGTPSPPFQMLPLSREQKRELSLIKRPIRLGRKYEGSKDVECIVAPILLDGKVFGNITCWGENEEHMEVDLAIMEKASTLLALEFLKVKVKLDVQQQYKNEFLRDLFINYTLNAKDIQERGKTYNFSLDDSYICMAIQLVGKNGKEQAVDTDQVSQFESIIQSIQHNVIIGCIRRTLYVLCPYENEGDQELIEKAQTFKDKLKRSTASSTNIQIGIGRYHPEMDGIRRSFREADQAISLGKMIWSEKNVIHYNDLGVYHLISLASDSMELKRFCDESIGKLIEYDQDSDMELVETLRAYYQHNEKLNDTSNALYVHVNTLKYRMQKIEKITGYSLQGSEGKLTLYLGLKIYDYLSNGYRFR